MNKITANGIELIVNNGKVFINGKEIFFPAKLEDKITVGMENGNIVINNYMYNKKKGLFQKI